MQETFVKVFVCKPRATWNEVGLYLCWKEKCAWCGVWLLWLFGCLVVSLFGCFVVWLVVVVFVAGRVVLLHVYG